MKKMPILLVITGLAAGMLGAYALHLNDQGAPFIQAGKSDFQQHPVNSIAVTPIANNTQPTLKTNRAQAKSPAETKIVVNEIDYLSMNPEYPTLEYRLEEMKARRDGQDFDADKVRAVLQMASAWREDASVAVNLPVDAVDEDDGRTFIKFEPMKIESLMPGDEMVLPVSQENREFKMLVESVEVHGDGVVTWRGHLKDFTEQNQVMISQANGNTQMGIFTPDAHYQVEVFGTQGWVVNSSKLFKRDLQSRDDVVINIPSN
jgi:hypothetical protein